MMEDDVLPCLQKTLSSCPTLLTLNPHVKFMFSSENLNHFVKTKVLKQHEIDCLE